jgi:hypothetical protein
MVFFNASEHRFNLSFSETLMLRNYALTNKYNFCSMIGGAESIRDLQEAKNLFINSFEFSIIESNFALIKICKAIEKVFSENLNLIKNSFIFINISTVDGIELIKNIKDFNFPDFINRELIVFNLDRRLITKNIKNIEGHNFEYAEFEDEIDPLINDLLFSLKNNKYKSSISGGINEKSLEKYFNNFLLPDFFKTGLFTLGVKDTKLNLLLKDVFLYQKKEVQILKLLRDTLYYRYDYIDKRFNHLEAYLKSKE